ncbi:uncharacterized protein Gasu_65490 [Galdieria sulphuraria]|uniref:Uncharacterized protein n=1 Tax=Galdieria sulphuraria TaxID=130081 RepID=M2XQT5_GALSU|nr:uncharacterized protein Gasu_65490 [Galdieria sulphuraria]EME25789.1 hypothetical protein Gasu_65490 [Galdieria sulphuraria]|eukprot:XP_005702309.1 hypothetical protein Gasu_65490 [Galdieria sulphuraria]
MSQSDLILNIRLIKSFEYRNIKYLVLKNVAPSTTGRELKELIDSKIRSSQNLTTFVNCPFDTVKIYTLSDQSFKDHSLVINFDQEGWIIGDGETLQSKGISSGAEVSYFNMEQYRRFKENPILKW